MTERTHSVITEPDEATAPLAFLYFAGVVTWLFAVLAWVYYFRGYA